MLKEHSVYPGGIEVPDPQHEERIIDILTRSRTIIDLRAHSSNNGLHSRDVPEYFVQQKNRAEPVVHTVAGKNPSRYPIGVALSRFSARDPLPKNIVDPHASTDAAYSIDTYDPYWNLCETSEQRMSDSIDLNAVLAVGDGNLIVKFWGRLTALCVRSFSTTQGTFVEGNWYSAKSVGLRKKLREAFVAGDSMPEITEGNWLLMRSLPDDMNGNTLMQKAKVAAPHIPHSLPEEIMGRTRESFMHTHMESFRDGLGN